MFKKFHKRLNIADSIYFTAIQTWVSYKLSLSLNKKITLRKYMYLMFWSSKSHLV